MTTRRWIVALAATAVAVSATAFARLVLEDEAPVAGALRRTIRSTVLGEDRAYDVHLPEGYSADTTARFPVLYVLDGTSQSGHTVESAAVLARMGVIPRMIVVGISSLDGETRNRDFTPPEMRLDTGRPARPGGAADRVLSFLPAEPIGRIERGYRPTPPRMTAGWALGGLFVVFSELVAPALFDARFAHSPALWPGDELIVARLQQALTAGALPPGVLYLSLGDEENARMARAFRHAVTVLERDAPATLRWRADLSLGGVHQSDRKRTRLNV